MFRYNVEYLKDEKGAVPVGKKCGRLVDIMLDENFSAIRSQIATDFRSTLISSVEIPLSDEPYSVKYRIEGEEEAGENAKTYQLRIQKTGTLTISELINYLTSSNAGAMLASKEEIIQALNIVVGNYPKSSSHVFSVGANRHYPSQPDHTDKWDLGAGLNAIRGFFVSVRAATARIIVNVQVKNTPCYRPGRLDQLIREFGQVHGPNRVELDKFLKRLRVRVTHIVRKSKTGKEIPRIKVISGIATPRDGREQPKPPRVKMYGATAEGVEFFLNSPGTSSEPPKAGGKKKGKKGKGPAGAPAAAPSEGQYISVFEFFRQSEFPQLL
jgi:eukaryotic translation initiation factor 2C